MDHKTLAAYDAGAAAFAQDWHAQPAPIDLYAIVRRFFQPGRTADIGCGSGREAAWLAEVGFSTIGYDASEALLAEARRRYPKLAFEQSSLPELAGISRGAFDNVLCETVIMHLPRDLIAPSVRRLTSIVKPGGTVYLSWRVAETDQRDAQGRLYTAFGAGLVRDALGGTTLLLDEEAMSASSARRIHRMIARRNDA